MPKWHTVIAHTFVNVLCGFVLMCLIWNEHQKQTKQTKTKFLYLCSFTHFCCLCMCGLILFHIVELHALTGIIHAEFWYFLKKLENSVQCSKQIYMFLKESWKLILLLVWCLLMLTVLSLLLQRACNDEIERHDDKLVD